MEQIQDLLLYMPALLLALCCHEFAHAWVAVRQGDDTPLRDGRVTLDPRAHVDPIGTVLFPIIGFLSGAPLLGWAKPVMTDPRKYRSYVSGDIKVSLAGVTANLILAILFGVASAFLLPHYDQYSMEGTLNVLAHVAIQAVLVNVGLLFFNLIPVPPLDGSHVLAHFLPASLAVQYRELQRYGFILLYLLVLTGALRLLSPVILAVAEALIFVPAGFLGTA
jgi:Zn-dependent protease